MTTAATTHLSESSTLDEIAAAHGTPVYVLDLDRLDRNYTRFEDAWSRLTHTVDVFYSLKTNYLPIVCRQMRRRGAGADVVSGHELEAALTCGFAGDRIVLNGPMKTREEIEGVVDVGGSVNVDALDDIRTLEECARRHGRRLGVGLRVNPGLSPYTSHGPGYDESASAAARRSKFGWPLQGQIAARVADRIVGSPHLHLTAIHCQLGSQITDTDAFLAAIERVIEFAAAQADRADLRVLNVGGGFGVPGIHRRRAGPIDGMHRAHGAAELAEERQEFDLDRFVTGLDEALGRHRLTGVTVASEPGRILVSDAVALLTRVVSVKDVGDGIWVILDGGVNLLPTAGVDEEHEMAVVGKAEVPRSPFMVGGPLCYDADVFSYGKPLAADVAVGDLVEIRDAGAYSITRSTSFMRGRAPVVAISGGRTELCWERESSGGIFAPAVYTRFDAEADR